MTRHWLRIPQNRRQTFDGWPARERRSVTFQSHPFIACSPSFRLRWLVGQRWALAWVAQSAVRSSPLLPCSGQISASSSPGPVVEFVRRLALVRSSVRSVLSSYRGFLPNVLSVHSCKPCESRCWASACEPYCWLHASMPALLLVQL